jgi:hypothetical protein
MLAVVGRRSTSSLKDCPPLLKVIVECLRDQITSIEFDQFSKNIRIFQSML